MTADGAVLVAAVALLVAHNLLIERLPAWAYVPVGLATTAALLGLAAAAGIGLDAVGLAASALPTGLAVGVAGGLLVATVIAGAALAPRTRMLFADQRMAGVGPGAAAYQVAVRIPMGTVVLEEVAFRGVLVALVAGMTSTAVGVAAASALFGLWHVVPTRATLDRNGVATTGRARALAVTGAVVFTALAGLVFCGLRSATDSLMAPALVHAAANGAATIAAFVVLRSG